MTYKKNILTIILTLVLLPLVVYAQIKIHKHLSTADGLVDNKVLSIFQDSKGYLWFGTFGGVSKWDGNSFTNITKTDGLPSPAILDIAETPDGTMLFSTYGKGFVTYKDGIIDTINKDDGLNSNMVFRFQKIVDETIIISDKPQKFKLGKIIDYPNIPDLLKKGIASIIIEENGDTYLSSRIGGFYVKEGNFEKLFTVDDGLITNKIYAMKKDYDNNILIGTYEGINKYKDGKISTLKYKGKPIKAFIGEIVVAKDSTNYYASEIGLIIEKGNNVEILTTENGLLENDIVHIFEDNVGNIYLGYNKKGISIFKPNRFTNYIAGINEDKFIANSIIQTKDSKIFLGTNKGLTDLSENKKLKNIDLTNNTILSLAIDKNDKLIIGTKRGFNILSDSKVEKYFLGNNSNNGIYCMDISSDGNILMGVRRKGIIIFTPNELTNSKFIDDLKKLPHPLKQEKVNGGILTYVTSRNGLQNTFILSLLNCSDSTLVLGYQGGGISFLKDGIFKHLKKEDGLTDGIVTTIFEDKTGAYWFGTRTGGISIYQNGLFDTINVDNGLSSNDIRGIVQVNEYMYVSTANGFNVLVKYSDGYFVRQINEDDGLASNNCNRNAILLDNENNILIGTSKGISKYNPSADKIISTPPKIILTGLKIFNEKYSLDKFIKEKELKYDQNYLKFYFTGMNLSAPEKTKYKFRLSNLDKDWIETNNNTALYTFLDNGKYTFEVKAGNEWGYWSNPIILSFVITPPWWETWWFRLAVISFIGGLLWAAFQYRLNYLLKLERLRTKIASDLHDEVGSLLTQISLNVDLLSYTKDENKRIEKSNLIRNKSKEVINMMSDVIWSIDSRNDDMESLVYRIQNFAESFLKQKNIALNFSNKIENMHKPLKINFRQNIMMIAKEAINNAVKYSDCKIIEILLTYKNNIFEMIISDDGKGFDIGNIKRGNGINNIKMRANLIDAKVEFINDNGCKIHLTKSKL